MLSNYWMKFLCFMSSPSVWRCQGRKGMLCHKCLACSIFNLGCRTTLIFYTIYSIICVFITSRPWLGPKPSKTKPSLRAWAWPHVFWSLSCQKPGPSWAHTSLALSLHPLSTANLGLGHPLCPHPTLQPWLQLTHSVPIPSKLRSCPSFQIHQQNLDLLGGSVHMATHSPIVLHIRPWCFILEYTPLIV